ncbi:MAG: pilus assembly protein [Myxococcaceae bacterium]|nr:pilus assembly protein [Myxococcaceae bacterium]
MSRRQARGQAVLELALGSLVFVTILLFGIHFSEVVVTQMKVTEAASSSMWDITAGRMHTWPGSIGPSNAAVASARVAGQARYRNFDGRVVAPTVRATPSLTQVLTSAENMRVNCQPRANLDHFPTILMRIQYNFVYSDTEGARCLAEADVRHGGVIRVMQFLQDAQGFFRARQFDGRGAGAGGVYHTCSMGRARFGTCQQELGMMTDDWGMSNGGGPEAVMCPVIIWGIPCPNMPYWTSTNMVYQLTSIPAGVQSGADRTLIQAIYGVAPLWIPFISSPTSFYMTFVGEELGFMGITPWATDPIGWSWVWQTTPFLFWPTYAAAYAASSGCYLGQACNTSSAAMP